jgi:hypothetical protein
MRQETGYKLPSNSRWIGEARGDTREQLLSQALQLRRRSVALFASLLFLLLLDAPCSGGDSTPAQAKGKGRVTVVYQDDAIQSKKETKPARQQAREDLEDEDKVLPAKIRQIRGGQCDHQSVVRLLLWNCLERRNRFVDHHPRQFIFHVDRFLRRKPCRIVERRNCEIDRVRIFRILEKQMRAAACSEGANPIRIGNPPRFTLCHDQVLAWHRSPLHIRCAGASTAINAMTIDQRNWSTLQRISCPPANASTCDFHKIV